MFDGRPRQHAAQGAESGTQVDPLQHGASVRGSRARHSQVEPEVQRRRRMGQRADRQVVHPGGGHLGAPGPGSARRRPPAAPAAARTARPAHRLRRVGGREVVQQDEFGAGADRLVELVQGVDLHLQRDVGVARRAPPSIAARTEPAAATWLSLISAASPRLIRWLTPPPQRTAYFSSARSPGSVLRVSRIRAPVPATASTQARVAVAMPDRWVSRFSAVRSAVSIPAVVPRRSPAPARRAPARPPSATSCDATPR